MRDISGNRAVEQAVSSSTPKEFSAALVADRLSRYEAILWRQVAQILFALDALDRRKPQERGRRFRSGSRPNLTAYERDKY
jgi:hypothetical protein